MSVKKIYITILFVTLFAFPFSSYGEPSKEYSYFANRMWTAFQCSNLALLSKDNSYKQLRDIGYRNGKLFLESRKKYFSKTEDLKLPTYSIIPDEDWNNNNFILGYIYAQAQQEVNFNMNLLGVTLQMSDDQIGKKALKIYQKIGCVDLNVN